MPTELKCIKKKKKKNMIFALKLALRIPKRTREQF